MKKGHLNKEKKYILMVVYNKIEFDPRVIRAAESISEIGEEVVVLSCNSSADFSNKKFISSSYFSKRSGPLLLLSFWIYILGICLKYRDNIKLIYVHDYFLSFVGYIISKLIKKPWVYDAHELLIQRKTYKYSI